MDIAVISGSSFPGIDPASWELCSAIGKEECLPRQGLRTKWPVSAPVSAVALFVENRKQMECRLQVSKNFWPCGIKKMAGESLTLG